MLGAWIWGQKYLPPIINKFVAVVSGLLLWCQEGRIALLFKNYIPVVPEELVISWKISMKTEFNISPTTHLCTACKLFCNMKCLIFVFIFSCIFLVVFHTKKMWIFTRIKQKWTRQNVIYHVEVHKHNTRVETFGIFDQKETSKSTISGTLDLEVFHIAGVPSNLLLSHRLWPELCDVIIFCIIHPCGSTTFGGLYNSVLLVEKWKSQCGLEMGWSQPSRLSWWVQWNALMFNVCLCVCVVYVCEMKGTCPSGRYISGDHQTLWGNIGGFSGVILQTQGRWFTFKQGKNEKVLAVQNVQGNSKGCIQTNAQRDRSEEISAFSTLTKNNCSLSERLFLQVPFNRSALW